VQNRYAMQYSIAGDLALNDAHTLLWLPHLFKVQLLSIVLFFNDYVYVLSIIVSAHTVFRVRMCSCYGAFVGVPDERRCLLQEAACKIKRRTKNSHNTTFCHGRR
jgi:hypothetical protein